MNYSEIHLSIVKHLVENTFKHTYKANSIEDILWDVAYNCSRLLGLEDMVIYVYDPDQNILVQKASFGEKEYESRKVTDPIIIEMGKGITGYVAESKVPEIVNDCSEDSRYVVDDKQKHSEISVPLVFEDQLIGVIDSEHSNKNYFTQHHLDIFNSISSICAVKIAEMIANTENEGLARFFNEAPFPKIRLSYDGYVINKNKIAHIALEKWGVENGKVVSPRILGLIRVALKLNKEKTIEIDIDGDTYNFTFAPIVEKKYVNVYSNNITDVKKAQLSAEKANKVKDKFLSVISHEIRTPLNAIIGSLNLLRLDSLTENQLSHLETVDFASEKLLVLLNNILDVEKIEAQEVIIDNGLFNLGKLLDNLKKTLSFESERKGNTLDFNIEKNAYNTFYGDETKIYQILFNLLSNAIKFTDTGHISLSVTSISNSEDKHRFSFQLTDTGIGISENKLKYIFKPFQQAESSISRRYGGTGLGLAISKSLVELLGGHITVSSLEGEGTTFVVYLDLQKSEPEKVKPEARLIEKKTAFNSNLLKNVNVLLVDDNRINLKIGGQFLERFGASLITAENGKMAVELFKNNQLDLILMDVHMPVCDGFEATKVIRASNSDNSNVPIIAVTADVTKENRKMGEKVGVNGFISKPFSPQSFIDTIQSVLDKCHA
ncbi:MAG: response regulator [Winogradskyella sp.]|uniref:ATP-binding protein n=1 Tax=Winogradskyella sp. TaxID=1883156 RepID=UPI0025D75C92|nr:ATP-binding protein [Winogradskyella sp.]NRB58368.1 response regulator [Winogradskyella sp.]